MSELTSDDSAWLHLVDGSERTAALLEFKLSPQVVAVFCGPRLMASIPRHELSRWLTSGEDPMTTDALVWTLQGHRIGLSIGLRPPLLIPEVFVLDLLELIGAEAR